MAPNVVSPENQWNKFKKKLITLKGRQKISERHVLDIVADKGDYATTLPGEEYPVPSRIRINSPLIINILNEILTVGFPLPQPCILVHPFKLIVDNEAKIREHLEILARNYNASLATKEPNKPSESIETISNMMLSGQVRQKCGEEHSGVTVEFRKATKQLAAAKDRLVHFHCLVEILDTNLKSEFQTIENIKAGTATSILFSDLWHLFPPGEIIYCPSSEAEKQPQAYKVIHVSGGRPRISNRGFPWFFPDEVSAQYAGRFSPFHIDCMLLDFDGKHIRPSQMDFQISYFAGSSPITMLRVYPLRLLDKAQREPIQEFLSSRGETFFKLAVQEANHKEYVGYSLGPEEKVEINSRIIVDFAEALNSGKLQEHEKSGREKTVYKYRGIRPTSDEERKPRMGIGFYSTTDMREYAEVTDEEQAHPDWFDDNSYDNERTEALTKECLVLKPPAYEMDLKDVTEADYILFPGYVYAYVLRLRKWYKCDVSIVKDVDINEDGFKNLVLPNENRELMKALVQIHTRGPRPVNTCKAPEIQEGIPDLVKGKGKGLIILLHGAPGTGKTSTAETIAEATGRPLLPVTCGDMGDNAQELETNLEKLFTLAHRWGCVLLLDEADAFLVKRDPSSDMRRNAMVSVFLRVLEYYSGILFLTTNRIGDIDEGFKSRIHVSLEYPPLDWKTTKKIWKVNIKRAADRVEADEEKLLKFARKHYENDPEITWNGRQIFNAFQTAVAMTENEHKKRSDDQKGWQGPKVIEVKHFRTIAKISDKFERYLKQTYGFTSSEVARQNRVRADSFERKLVARFPSNVKASRMSDIPSPKVIKKGKSIYEDPDSDSVSSDESMGRGKKDNGKKQGSEQLESSDEESKQ